MTKTAVVVWGNPFTALPPVASTAGQPELWPPDVDFCHLLYCDQVYCCPPPAGGSEEPNTTAPFRNTTGEASSRNGWKCPLAQAGDPFILVMVVLPNRNK